MLNAIESLQKVDSNFTTPKVVQALLLPENSHLLNYVIEDAFGAHVFPGNVSNYTAQDFLYDMNRQLSAANPIHLWTNLPLCERRCFFCQFPIAITRNDESRDVATQKWLDANLYEASLWLEALPNLRHVPIGEFNILGGTPTLFSNQQLKKLIEFYRSNFNFTHTTTIRIEGTASSFNEEKLTSLKQSGFNKVSCGIQSFDNLVLKQANCAHQRADAIAYIQTAKKLKFDSVNADFIYGLLNQSVEQFLNDIEMAIKMEVSCIVITKLHLKSFTDTRTAVSGEKNALWQSALAREDLSKNGHHWPSLGEQYQMREEAVKLLQQHGYREHPTMYFYHPDKHPEKWKSLVVDQDKQYAELGMGMGGSSSCINSEAINATTAKSYFSKLQNKQIPIESVQGFNAMGKVKKSLQMALSTCQPLSNAEFKRRFKNLSLFAEPFHAIFVSLEKRGLVKIEYDKEIITPTCLGKTLIEAIIHTELNRLDKHKI